MTEEEKRQAIQAFLEAERQRPAAHHVFDAHTAAIEASLRAQERKQEVKRALAQQGITWEQLRDAYNEEYEKGHNAMLDHHLAYFYAGIAIAFKERMPSSSPEEVADFVKAVYAMPDEITDRASMVRQCLAETGVDVGSYDEEISIFPSRATMNTSSKATRKDREAVERMRRSGITPSDLTYERDLGYKNGWNSGFAFSVCYGAVAMVLHRQYGWAAAQIENFIERVEELRYEEITVEDIVARARKEADVDVSGLVKVQ